MGRQRSDRERRAWAEESVRLGIPTTARRAGVSEGTITKWRSKFGITAGSAISATAPLELHDDIDLDGVLLRHSDVVCELPSSLSELQREAIQGILNQPMLKSRQAAQAIGSKFTGKRGKRKIEEYRDRSWLLGLPSENDHLFPKFQFDHKRHEIFPEVRRVNELLEAFQDPWGTASWWISHNARLDAKPMEFVGTSQANRLIAAAEAVIEPIG